MGRSLHSYLSALVIVVYCSTGTVAVAEVIYDKLSFPDGSTVIDFESRGNGESLVLPEGGGIPLFSEEYLPAGVTFSNSGTLWIANDGGDLANRAQEIVGSPNNFLVDIAARGTFRIDFAIPVTAVGFAVVDFLADPADTSLVSLSAYGSGNQLIEALDFSGDLIDGVIWEGDQSGRRAIYGFMGVLSRNEPISFVIVTEGLTDFDDILFTPIPETGTAVLVAILGFFMVWFPKAK